MLSIAARWLAVRRTSLSDIDIDIDDLHLYRRRTIINRIIIRSLLLTARLSNRYRLLTLDRIGLRVISVQGTHTRDKTSTLSPH